MLCTRGCGRNESSTCQDTNAKKRLSTVVQLKKNSQKVAGRGKTLPGALCDLTEDDGNKNPASKKHKNDNINNKDAKSIVEKQTETHQLVAFAVTKFAESLAPQKKDDSLKEKIFEHHKCIDVRKVTFEERELQLKYNFMNIELERTAMSAMLQNLKCEYEDAIIKL